MLKKIGVFVAAMTISGLAMAATEPGATAFEGLYNMLVAWTTGFLGKSLSLAFLLIGIGVGVVRGSIMGAVACIAAAFALLVGPDVIIAILDSAAGA